MEPFEAVVELYVSKAGFRFDWPVAAMHQSTLTCEQCFCGALKGVSLVIDLYGSSVAFTAVAHSTQRTF